MVGVWPRAQQSVLRAALLKAVCLVLLGTQ